MSSDHKAAPRQRHWCFTSFLPNLNLLNNVFHNMKYIRYCIYQQEKCLTTQRKHWQGYVEFYDPMRLGQCKKYLGEAHLEPRRGTRTDAREYCRKKDTAIVNTLVELGEWRKDVNNKRKLDVMLKTDMSLDEFIEEAPEYFVCYHRGLIALYNHRAKKKARIFRSVVVTVLYGVTGCGKTTKATEGDDWFIMPSGKGLWFDHYDREKTLIIDDFYGGIKYHILLRLLDGHCQQVPYKGGFVYAFWTNVIITSNKHPNLWYKMGLTAALERRLTTNGSTITEMLIDEPEDRGLPRRGAVRPVRVADRVRVSVPRYNFVDLTEEKFSVK